MQVGSGLYTYQWIEGWAKVPAGKQTGYTHGVVTDKNDNVYIFNQSEDAMMIFDADGNFISSWGKAFAAGAHGLVIHEEAGVEYLYLSDIELKAVVKTTLDGKELMRIGMPPHAPTQAAPEKYVPTWTTIGPNGDIYIADGYGLFYIHQYDKAGNYIRSWGGPGDSEGLMNCPHGITVVETNGTHEIYVADRGNVRLQVFTLAGKHKRSITADMLHPDVVFEKNGVRYIPDLFSRVTLFDANDKLICHLGEYPEGKEVAGWPNVAQEELHAGKFSAPHSVWVDSQDDMYVVEWHDKGRITKLKRCK